MRESEWFEDWFNSKYYFLLYNNRNDVEAKRFIVNLFNHLSSDLKFKVWDMACAKGRHCRVMNELGHVVTGTDLAKDSIKAAIQQSKEDIEFYIHDMRLPFRSNYFDVVVNLFTSIGYFKRFEDNLKVIKNAASALKPNGYFVIDFLNATKVISCLKPESIEEREDIRFYITKRIENNQVIKTIKFVADKKNYSFEERVTLLNKSMLLKFAELTELKLQNIFGNYNLEPFDEINSERLILVFKK
jgi:2-polyprenyl-3-methyl-5-hydroxy-6-metoxy-1,4-benzoquinol methylase